MIDISSGDSHTMALSNEGDVYSWGENYCGQIGSGNFHHQSIPLKIYHINKL
jgi:alpha-tubulin suppressor-like RCC1 family protein